MKILLRQKKSEPFLIGKKTMKRQIVTLFQQDIEKVLQLRYTMNIRS